MNVRNSRIPLLAAAFSLLLGPAAAAQVRPDPYDPYGSDTLVDEIEAETQRQLDRQRGQSGTGADLYRDERDLFGQTDPFDPTPFDSTDPLDPSDPLGADPFDTDPFGADRFGTDPFDTDRFDTDPFGTDRFGQSQLEQDRFGESDIFGGSNGVGRSELIPSDPGLGLTQPRSGSSFPG